MALYKGNELIAGFGGSSGTPIEVQRIHLPIIIYQYHSTM